MAFPWSAVIRAITRRLSSIIASLVRDKTRDVFVEICVYGIVLTEKRIARTHVRIIVAAIDSDALAIID